MMAIQDTARSPSIMPPELDTDVANLLPGQAEKEEFPSTSPYAAPRSGGPNADSAVYRLPFELLDHILTFMVHESPNLLPFDKRSSLSTESFASAPPHVPEDIIYLHKFRRTCSRFFHAGRSRLFARQNIRFSPKSFDRIRRIAQHSDQAVAREVRKVSYMVHNLYPQGETRMQEILDASLLSTANCQRRLDDIRADIEACHTPQNAQSMLTIQRLNADLARLQRNEQIIRKAMARAKEQRWIMQGKIDEDSLAIALTAFKGLQQIRLMRNVDDLDRDWTNFLNSRSDLRDEFGTSQWTLACEHATMVLARACSRAKSTAHRLSSRFMDPRAAWLQEFVSEADISSLSTRLTCLELQIGDSSDVNKKMNDLSSVFGALFHAAKGMEGLHIGLLHAVSIPLETIFHNVAWSNLLYIGFSRWILNSDEIICFLRRHRGSLNSVRFREVRLKEGSWIDIAKVLRRELKLKWVSFRQVGYDPSIGGGPVPEAPLGGFAMLRGLPREEIEDYSSEDSDDIGDHVGAGNHEGQSIEQDEIASENDDSESENSDTDETVEAVSPGINDTTQSIGDDEATSSENDSHAGPVYEGDHDDDQDDSPFGSVAADSDVGVVNELALDDQIMVQHSSATGQRPSVCHCKNGYAWDDLPEDNGLDPTKSQWKWWERWVRWGCVEHDLTEA